MQAFLEYVIFYSQQEGALGIPRPNAFMWFGAVAKPGGGNLVRGAVIDDGPIPNPFSNLVQFDMLCDNLQLINVT